MDSTLVLWYADGHFTRLGAAPRGGGTLIEDESRFVDFARSSIFLIEEHEIFDYTK